MWICGDSLLQPPVDAEVTVLLRRQDPPAPPPTESHRLDVHIKQAQTEQPVPDPIQLRGVGTTTL